MFAYKWVKLIYDIIFANKQEEAHWFPVKPIPGMCSYASQYRKMELWATKTGIFINRCTWTEQFQSLLQASYFNYIKLNSTSNGETQLKASCLPSLTFNLLQVLTCPPLRANKTACIKTSRFSSVIQYWCNERIATNMKPGSNDTTTNSKANWLWNENLTLSKCPWS